MYQYGAPCYPMFWSLHGEEDCHEDVTDEIEVRNSWVGAQLAYVSDTFEINKRGDFHRTTRRDLLCCIRHYEQRCVSRLGLSCVTSIKGDSSNEIFLSDRDKEAALACIVLVQISTLSYC